MDRFVSGQHVYEFQPPLEIRGGLRVGSLGNLLVSVAATAGHKPEHLSAELFDTMTHNQPPLWCAEIMQKCFAVNGQQHDISVHAITR